MSVPGFRRDRRTALAGLVLASVATLGSIVLAFGHPDLIAYVVLGAWVVFLALLGTLVAVRRPENPIGWLFLASATFIALSSLAQSWVESSPTFGGFTMITAWLTLWLAVPGFAIFVWVFLLFPTGRLLGPNWVWVGRAAGVGLFLMVVGLALRPGPLDSFPTLQNPMGLDSAKTLLEVVRSTGEGLLIAAGIGATTSLVLRTVRARGVERLQMRWFALAVLSVPVAFFVGQALQPLDPTEEDALTFLLMMVALLAIPATMGLAILRYRLYDIDRLINRTLVYATLTALLAGAYLLAVLVLQSLLPLRDDSPAIVAASTLAVVGAFGPLRSRVQGVVDRRFFRTRYDAAQTVELFGVRLRSETNLELLTQDLVSVAQSTMQPTQVSLWLRPAGDRQ
jgi:MFS family permease